MQVAPSDLAWELSNHPTVLLASAEFLASTEVPLRHLMAHNVPKKTTIKGVELLLEEIVHFPSPVNLRSPT